MKISFKEFCRMRDIINAANMPGKRWDILWLSIWLDRSTIPSEYLKEKKNESEILY